MSMIDPTTQIFFCSDVPLDNRYRNTLFFANRASQEAYFRGKVVCSMTECTYQRQTMAIRAPCPISQLINCNYLFFQNPDFEARFFFAFITGVHYVNNGMTSVTFEIDLMQTYLLDGRFGQCFIERGHTGNDTLGANLVPEGLETGDYVIKDMIHTAAIEPQVICMAVASDSEGNPVDGGYYSNVYSGLKIEVFQTAASANEFIKTMTEANAANAIVSVFMMPHTFQEGAGTVPKLNTFNVQKPYDSISGYTPKNNKLYTYPYNVLYITNGEGIAGNFKYELFSGSQCSFNVWGSMCTTPQAMLVPLDYKGLPVNYDEKIALDGWPQCAWTVDSYQAWLAQNANIIAWQNDGMELARTQQEFQTGKSTDMTILNALGTIGSYAGLGAAAGSFAPGAGNAAGALIGGGIGALKSAYDVFSKPAENTLDAINTEHQIAGIMASRADHSTMPPQARGGGAGTVMSGLGLKTFFIYRKQIRAEFAKIIDDYFTMYGYAQHKAAFPNINARSRYTYIQTKGCNFTGNAPVAAVAGINKIMDNGITFWHDYSGVGNYQTPNTPNGTGDY